MKKQTIHKKYTVYGNLEEINPVEVVTEGSPFSQIYIPSRGMNPGGGTSAPIFYDNQIGSREITYGVWDFAKVNPGKVVSFEFAIHGAELDISSPQFTVYPIFYQDQDNTVSGLNVEFSSSIRNFNVGDSLDVDYDPDPPAAKTLIMPVRNKYLVNGGSIADYRNGMLLTPQGATIEPGESNLFTCMLERHSDFGVNDTYTKSVLLVGCIIQFKNNYANISQIPSA